MERCSVSVLAATLPSPDPPLGDGVVTLRPPDDRDLRAIERGLHDPDVMRAFGRPTMSAEQLLELNRSRWDNGEAATFSICDASGGCVGHVFVNLSGMRRGSVGYWLLPEARGKGLATRAVTLVSRWALRELALARLALLTEPSNRQSQRVAERSRFHREGVLRSYTEIDGRRVDNVVYSLLPSDLSTRLQGHSGTRHDSRPACDY
jgi:ribosomal-protein-alanine N-acetyltransferase